MKQSINTLLIVTVSFIASLTGCCREDAQLEEALKAAGGNRVELEAVLKHYAGDSLKLEAAKFLIRNMPGHYSYADTMPASRYYDAVDSLMNAFHGQSAESIRDSIDILGEQFGMGNQQARQDVEIITSEFLIRNIDGAFRQWQESPWCRHLTFEDFCEYILPYKSEELQPMDDWRGQLAWLYEPPLRNLEHCDVFRNSSYRAAALLNQEIVNLVPSGGMLSLRYPVMRLLPRIKVPFGLCADYVGQTTALFRCAGIPVVWDFTPQWASQKKGHDWNVLLSERTQEIPFCGFYATPNEYHKPYEKMSKVYRHTYAQNLSLKELNHKEPFVPKLFRNIFLRDVTEKYTATGSVALSFPDEPDGYVYLATFDSKEWVPVAVAPLSSGKARFDRVGKDCVFLPVRYDDNGVQRPVGAPFEIGFDGGVRHHVADMGNCHSVRLLRKYPVLIYVFVEAETMVDGEFQAADMADFSDAETVYVVRNAVSHGVEFKIPDSIAPHRYWRYVNDRPHTNSHIAEISFLDDSAAQIKHGRIIGSEPLWGDPALSKEKAFDGDILTRFSSTEDFGGWVGMDFGKPVRIGTIRYYPRGDGNAVEVGDLYELFYWASDGWQSLGRQKATSVALSYDNVPAGALLLLRDLTKGSDEWIFTYENHRQNWR